LIIKAVVAVAIAADLNFSYHQGLAYLQTTALTEPYLHPCLAVERLAKVSISRSLSRAILPRVVIV
jgi:hypothetical protein